MGAGAPATTPQRSEMVLLGSPCASEGWGGEQGPPSGLRSAVLHPASRGFSLIILPPFGELGFPQAGGLQRASPKSFSNLLLRALCLTESPGHFWHVDGASQPPMWVQGFPLLDVSVRSCGKESKVCLQQLPSQTPDCWLLKGTLPLVLFLRRCPREAHGGREGLGKVRARTRRLQAVGPRLKLGV